MAERRPLVFVAGRSRELAVGDTVSFSLLSSRPTTLAGYGITDAAPISHVGSGGTAHAVATTTANGFMAAADKVKLNGIATGATANTGTVTSVAVANATGITWAGSPITGAGTLTPTLSANLQAWSGIDPSAKANLSGAAFTGAISASNLSGTNTGDQDLSGLMPKSGGTFDLSYSTSATVTFLQPGSTPAGSFVQITSPNSNPGITGQFGTTKRRDVQFTDTGIQLAVSSTISGTEAQFTFAENGAFIATGAISASNLSGTNTGDQNLAPYALLSGAAFTGAITIANTISSTFGSSTSVNWGGTFQPIAGALGRGSGIRFGATFASGWGGADTGVRLSGGIAYIPSTTSAQPRDQYMALYTSDVASGSDTPTVAVMFGSDGWYIRANNSASLIKQPRTFVQSGDPGAAAADGDLWIW